MDLFYLKVGQINIWNFYLFLSIGAFPVDIWLDVRTLLILEHVAWDGGEPRNIIAPV